MYIGFSLFVLGQVIGITILKMDRFRNETILNLSFVMVIIGLILIWISNLTVGLITTLLYLGSNFIIRIFRKSNIMKLELNDSINRIKKMSLI
jgi:type IV secretory pathway VirB3-like protein